MNLDHLADLQLSGLSEETIRVSGVYSVPVSGIGSKLGGNDNDIQSLLAFPYPGCDGYERFKCWYQEGKEGPKYRQVKGTANRLYSLPGTDLQGASPLLVVEGEKKTLALWQAGYQVVGFGGIWNWCERAQGYRRPKEVRPIADLDRLNWHRPVTILFDSDGYHNRLVRMAAFQLARELSTRGANASVSFIPYLNGDDKMGADDFLVSQGPDAYSGIFILTGGSHEMPHLWQAADRQG